jgi:hypothetical protein
MLGVAQALASITRNRQLIDTLIEELFRSYEQFLARQEMNRFWQVTTSRAARFDTC